MPSHYTPEELAVRERKRIAKASQPKQLSISFEIPEPPIRERVFESHGHHWLSRSNGHWEEHIQID